MAEKITAQEAAKRLGVNLRTVWRWRDAGRLTEAGREGRTVLFDAAAVDELRGVDRARELDMFEVYKRLTEAQEWADVERLRDEMAATICTTATDKRPLEASWRAACSMAATHPDEDARQRWRAKAERYGGWLGMRDAETAAAIERRGREGSMATYATAVAEAKAAPPDPAYAVAIEHAAGC